MMELLRREEYAGVNKYIAIAGAATVGTVAALTLLNKRYARSVGRNHLAIITGCDSGLGYAFANYCHEKLGMTVVAFVHDEDSTGAKNLRESYQDCESFYVHPLDVVRVDLSDAAFKFVLDLLSKNPNLRVDTFVNNCGVMVFGESEWLTDNLIDYQIGVNLAGTIKLTKRFLPLIRVSKARVINVTSHCALRSLPGLSVYGATKAGMKFYNDSLRYEVKKYGVKVVNFVPGSYVGMSNIANSQIAHAAEMKSAFNEEQKETFTNYFDRFQNYLRCIPIATDPNLLEGGSLLKVFEHCVMDDRPKSMYKNEPMRYWIYHFLMNYSPTQGICDYFMKLFVNMPDFLPTYV